MSDLQTGDLLLFVSDSSNWFFRPFTKMISWGTHSNYTHVAMVLRDPIFSDIPPLKGLYIWESSWNGTPDPQDGKVKLGVQITPLQQILEEYKDKQRYMKPSDKKRRAKKRSDRRRAKELAKQKK